MSVKFNDIPHFYYHARIRYRTFSAKTTERLPFKTAIVQGRGDGTFNSSTATFLQGNFGVGQIRIADMNNDGISDIVGVNSGTSDISAFYGVGDGTFLARRTLGTGDGYDAVSIGDLNNDGVLDVVTSTEGNTDVGINLATKTTTTDVQRFNLTTQRSALNALTLITTALDRVGKELGNIGASQSRLGTAVSNLLSSRENFEAAASQIRDVDVAEESAALVRNQILQRAGSQILAQANLQPSLALQLLRGA